MYMDINQKDFYVNEIKKITRRNINSRFSGWINNFHKIIFYNCLKKLNLTYPIKAKTFWNQTFDIILPETVSVNIWRNGFPETDVTLYLLRHLNRGETFIDIGAHFGFYSILASSIVGREGQVLSFEPTISTFNQLSKNISNYGNENIKIFNMAAFNSKTEMEFNDYGIINSAFNSFFANRGNDRLAGKKIKVNTIVLDDFLSENYSDREINMIKIDAESSEFQIITGLKNTISKHHPKIIVEIGDYSVSSIRSSYELVELIESLGYEGFELNKINFEIIPCKIGKRETYRNILFIPIR